MLLHFIAVIKRYEIWQTTEMWAVVSDMYDRMNVIDELLTIIGKHNGLTAAALDEIARAQPGFGGSQAGKIDHGRLVWYILNEIRSLWSQLRSLNGIYEEICREWFQPTYLSHVSSSLKYIANHPTHIVYRHF